MTESRKATAHPTKSFFVRMITRDISLEDCILDLIDNSIDGALSKQGSPPLGLSSDVDLTSYNIDVSVGPERFDIVDDCGGMTLDEAADYAFSFGRPDDAPQEDFSIGVYGIGMKRAVFKMGGDIRITSTYQDDAAIQSFCVPINVGRWLALKDDVWDFDIEEADDLPAPGVRVFVKDLNEQTRDAFGSPTFVNGLRRTVGRDYALHLARGLDVTVNGEPVEGVDIQLREGAEFKPVRVGYEDEVGGTSVKVEIVAGMAAPPPDDATPDEQKKSDERYGWYVVCNGRVVVAGDKTSVTGWGSEKWPQWHPQYSGFLGLIFFTASDAEVLPLTTTKRSVDTSSALYRRALTRARDVTTRWTSYTNARKQDLEEAKKREAASVSVSIARVEPSKSAVFPAYVSKPREKRANVNYSVPLDRMKALAVAYDRPGMSYRDVGLRTFDEAFRNNVGDD